MPTILKRIALSGAALLILLAASPARADTDISVMTQNQYLGADLAPLLAADPASFNAVLVAALQQIAENDFPARAERLAEQIAQRRPHVVGLQEVWSYQCFDLAPIPVGVPLGCNDPSIAGAFNDHLSVTLSKLAGRNAIYFDIATVVDLDLRNITIPGLPSGVPFFINGVPALLVALDRDVILVRGDVIAAGNAAPAPIPCTRSSANGCNFQTVLQAQVAGQPLNVDRGFVAVDATIDDVDYRIFNTHLEVRLPDPDNLLSSFFQAAQAAELIGTLAATTPESRELIVLGDINSSPVDVGLPGIMPPYAQFVMDGFVDIWATQPNPADGLTCCQAADLSNTASELYERIDMIFARDLPVEVKDLELVGDHVSDETPSGLWPSDHASVTAEIKF